MTTDQENALNRALITKLNDARMDGIVYGSRLICTTILKFAKASGPYNKRMNRIIEFCNKILKDSVMSFDLNSLEDDSEEGTKQDEV